jgi:hypothetical protein
LKLQYDEPLSIFAFNSILRRYTMAGTDQTLAAWVVDAVAADPGAPLAAGPRAVQRTAFQGGCLAGVQPARYCSPRHQHACSPLFLEFSGIL